RADGGGPLAGDVARPGDALHHSAAGDPQYHAGARQRPDRAAEGHLARLRARRARDDPGLAPVGQHIVPLRGDLLHSGALLPDPDPAALADPAVAAAPDGHAGALVRLKAERSLWMNVRARP